MMSFIKKLLRISPAKHSALSSKKKVVKKLSRQSTLISRENHRISKANISQNALKVLNRLHNEGYEACLVGGGVRDLLLGIAPKDFDVATNARPNEVSRLFRNSMLIGRRFRIVHVQFGREIIEVTTFRASEEHRENTEKSTSSPPQHHQRNAYGRKPATLATVRLKDKSGMIIQDNIFGDISQDAGRRDFTVNALYYNIADSSVVDFTGGYQDLKDKMIRLIGNPDTRYQEDPVRMLRAIRFSAKLNFTIEAQTAEPINRLAHLIKNVPSARLSEEIFKVYHNGAAQQSHRLLCQYGLFELFFPDTASLLGNEASENKLIQQALENTDTRFEQKKPVMPAFLLATMLWHPMLEESRLFQEEGDSPLEALEKAMSQVIHAQNQAVAMPKRHWQVVREIWLLQYRFPRRAGPRPFRLLQHPRFRAAYDFLLIRALAGEESIELADWWTTFQDATHFEQDAMIKTVESLATAATKKKKPRKKPKTL